MDISRECISCKIVKVSSEFYKDKRRAGGLWSQCKECYKTSYYEPRKEALLAKNRLYYRLNQQELINYQKEYRKKNSNHIRIKKISKYEEDLEYQTRAKKASRERYERNRESELENRKEYRVKNKEVIREKKRIYARNNPDVISALSAKRNASKANATPKWADMKEIRKIYKQASEISKCTGVKHHVDHIIPLRGKIVTGLHVASNLRIIPAVENIKKQNKFLEELL